MVRFDLCEFVEGGVVYEQLAQLDNVGAVFFSFFTCYSEASAMPFLTFRSAPGVRQFRVEDVTIVDYGNFDELSDDAIIRFNASEDHHSLDGVTIIGACGGTGHPAIEMVKGTLSGASFIDGHWYGASDAVDSVTGTVTGTYTSHSPGGFTFVGDSSRLAALRQDTNRSALDTLATRCNSACLVSATLARRSTLMGHISSVMVATNLLTLSYHALASRLRSGNSSSMEKLQVLPCCCLLRGQKWVMCAASRTTASASWLSCCQRRSASQVSLRCSLSMQAAATLWP